LRYALSIEDVTSEIEDEGDDFDRDRAQRILRALIPPTCDAYEASFSLGDRTPPPAREGKS